MEFMGGADEVVAKARRCFTDGDLRWAAEVLDSDKPVGLTLTIPAAALFALAGGNMDAARSKGLTTSGDESQLASLFSVLQPGNPRFNIVES